MRLASRRVATFVPKGPGPVSLGNSVHASTVAAGGDIPTIRLALRLILLTMVRKSESIEATWDEVDFEAAVWTIPKFRTKARRAHNVYLSRQSIDIMVALHTCAAAS
ncbi:phage integrase family protein [Paraburkholderia sp. GV068]|jgi:integrase|nr:phage integrase family protein [Paraburkholderia sp. GV072]PUB05130.1 phage integrase family protein [Paraburkholderia sp. GV068]